MDDLDAPPKAECVQVVVRCRPLNTKEKQNKNDMIVSMNRKSGEVSVRNPEGKNQERPKTFTYDTVFPPDTQQAQIYQETVYRIVQSVFDGYNGTIFAYGQTGTGKTFTMEGVLGDEILKGVIPRTFEHIFNLIESADQEREQFLVTGSFCEIYNDNVRDLLSNAKHAAGGGLELKEHPDSGVYIKDLQTFTCNDAESLHDILEKGKKNRHVGATNMNRDSSRSHCIFCIRIERSVLDEEGEAHIRVGKLNMVDLAGSERQGKTGAQGVRLKEATKINLSLSALGNVIAALTSNRKQSHIPYRDSKLTRLLQDSLGGNTKTVMIANVGPADYNFGETISTLRFASRAKQIENKPQINEDPKDAKIREFQDEIQRLRELLEAEEKRLAEGGSIHDLPALGRQTIVNEIVVEKKVLKGVAVEAVQEMQEEHERRARQIYEQHEQEKAQLDAQKEEVALKSKELQAKIKMKDAVIVKHRQNKEALLAQLQQVENNMVHGQQIISEAEKQKKILAKKKKELELRRIEADKAQRLLAQQEEDQLGWAEKYENQDKELESKTVKLNRLRDKYQEIKQEIEDLQAENQREREDMLETIRELDRHIKLKDAILQNFVPLEEREKINERAFWNAEVGEWQLAPIDLETLNSAVPRPSSAQVEGARPSTEYARAARKVGDANPRFKRENILTLEMDMPERTTGDFEEPPMDEPLYDDEEMDPYGESRYDYEEEYDEYNQGGYDDPYRGGAY